MDIHHRYSELEYDGENYSLRSQLHLVHQDKKIEGRLILKFDTKGNEIKQENENDDYYHMLYDFMKEKDILECTEKTIGLLEFVGNGGKFDIEDRTMDNEGYEFGIKGKDVSFYMFTKTIHKGQICGFYNHATLLFKRDERLEKIKQEAEKFLREKSKYRVKMIYEKD